MQYLLKKSRKRKTVAIKIKSGKVIVYAPEHICEQWLYSWVNSKSDWIASKLAQGVEHTKNRPLTTNKIAIFGDKFTIIKQAQALSFIDFDKKTLNLDESKDSWGELLKLLEMTLSDYLDMAIAKYQPDINAQFDTLKIRLYKSRWGSFSSKGVIAFNTLLVGAPKWVIEYVVVHELCHYHVMAHNSSFWSLVNIHYGEKYQDARKYLKEHGRALMIEN
ncbi:DUF45 domain-containing protein [Pseudoalteromonas sp. McH1-7]|nr:MULTISPECIES: YgjP-like metallopeptidase domain-containing protein [Pseudoalteromonas]NLR13580.1 M48 family metallopeptidase [Pseudoalteromonas peptidolytica]NUZ13322.1 DUF45 domain-containing protein [Pseudoalteromonas sp. McH1-7]USD29817.1 DUF45 domain-containing protein [Pseudoalteromonas sp. SCSIO 43201]GEK09624.1 hypothetical protein PPE03_18730 [Pseudoalteromonas peptidolytica]